MFYGAEKGDLEIVKLLIQGGANLSLKDKVLSLCGLIMSQTTSFSDLLSGKVSELVSVW